jgi:hypothetical protein
MLATDDKANGGWKSVTRYFNEYWFVPRMLAENRWYCNMQVPLTGYFMTGKANKAIIHAGGVVAS